MRRKTHAQLPRGRYVFLATLFSRMGGVPMRWNKPFDKPAASKPVRHRARFHDLDLPLNQPVHVLCPSQADLRPSHVIILQLFQLGTKRSPVDKVVGWTALPACDAEFDVVQGQYKLPLVRGPVNVDVTHYSAFEKLYASNLDAWLANVYVDVRHLSRECLDPDGSLTREFDVELAVTSEMLRTAQPS